LLSVVTLNVAFKPIMLSVIMPNVVMLSVVAPSKSPLSTHFGSGPSNLYTREKTFRVSNTLAYYVAAVLTVGSSFATLAGGSFLSGISANYWLNLVESRHYHIIADLFLL
jgi:hypothetical protein